VLASPSWAASFWCGAAFASARARVGRAHIAHEGHDVSNADIAARLFEIAALMEFDGEPFFKTKAYERAARSLEDSEIPARALIEAGTLEELPGVGKAIAQKIVDIEATGTCKYLEELRAKFPPTILELLRVPGVGTKTAIAMYQQLGITGLDDLRRCVEDGSIATLPRLGAKTIENLKLALSRLAERTRRMRLGDAWVIAEQITAALAATTFAKNVVVAGSLRRMEPTVGDLDVICTSSSPEKALDFFCALPGVERVTAKGDTKATVWLQAGIAADLRVVPHRCFGNLLQHFTGNKEHNIKLREFALRQGHSVSEWGIETVESGVVRTSATEAGVYEMLGLQFIPPELRQGLNEVDLAKARTLPVLVEMSDIRGDLHDHTTWSDGTRSIEQMARGAAARGLVYLSISDHSRGRAVGNGLSVERLREQIREVRAAAEQFGVRLLCSSEVDIRADGALDYPDEVLAELDVVVASIHSGFTGDAEKQTKRLLRAIENPYVNVIGHPTGVLIEERAGYEFDADAVFRAAASSGTALEINSHPARLDLSTSLARRAKELGCTLAIDTDAHSIEDFDNLRFGVGTARRAGLAAADVLNARPLEGVLDFVAAKRRAVPAS
jgi:DNA polymerase (family 10)